MRLLFTVRARYRDSPAESIEPLDLKAVQEILEAYLRRRDAAQSERSPFDEALIPIPRSGALSRGEDHDLGGDDL